MMVVVMVVASVIVTVVVFPIMVVLVIVALAVAMLNPRNFPWVFSVQYLGADSKTLHFLKVRLLKKKY